MKYETVSCVEAITRYIANNGELEHTTFSVLSKIFGEDEVAESIKYLVEQKAIGKKYLNMTRKELI